MFLHVKFHPGIKLVPGWNHPCLWWSFSLFTRFRRDEISSREELFDRDKFILGWKEEKKDMSTLHSGMRFYNEHVFTKFLNHLLNMLSSFNMSERNKSYKKYFIGHFYKTLHLDRFLNMTLCFHLRIVWNFLRRINTSSNLNNPL